MAAQSYDSLQDPDTLRMLVANLPAGVYITSHTGELLDANPACLFILGVESLEELRRHRAQELYVDPARREQEVDRLHRDGSIRDFEIELRRLSDGKIRTVLDTCYAVKDFKTGQIFFHGILVDISERKELQERLRRLGA